MTKLEAEVRDVSLQLAATCKEVSLLYRLTQKLKLTSDDRELAQLALEWLSDVLPAEWLAIQLTPGDSPDSVRAVPDASPCFSRTVGVR